MSLILDALKRAERERKLGQAPAALDELARRYGDEPGAIAADLDAFLAQLSTAGFLDHG